MKRTNRKGIVTLALVIGLLGAAITPAFSDEAVIVSGAVTPAIAAFYEDYGVNGATLAKASDDLTAAERQSLHAIYVDSDVRAALNGLLYSEASTLIADGKTVVRYTLAGRVIMFGTPDAFDLL